MIKRFLKYIWYFICGWPVRFFCVMFFRIRFYGIENVPKRGGFLLLSNHQSFIDPMLVVTPINRVCAFAIRDSLFKVPISGWMLLTYTSISIRRGHADLAALKECIEKLKAGYGLVLYPEGTRTNDGKIAKIKPGFGLLARRASVPIIPVIIDGAFECWPKHNIMFSPGRVFVQYGRPIQPDEIISIGDREFAKYLTNVLRDMQKELRLKIGREPFDYQDDLK
ncbi:MAG: lysophospholipid acyltransferase family protein [Phycisphaerae bacterium]